MTIGGSILLIVAGAILRYAINWSPNYVDLRLVGLILMIAGVVGLIIAFSAAKTGGSADSNEIRAIIASVIDGMYVSLYATLLGISTNLWLKINLRLLGDIDG